MRILWITYISSWTPTLLNAIKGEVQLALIIPSGGFDEFKHVENGVTYYSIKLKDEERLNSMSLSTFAKYNVIFNDFAPDVIHVHGTEANYAQLQNYTDIPIITSIQGILSGCIPYYNNFLENKKLRKFSSLKNLLGYGGIESIYKGFIKRSVAYENQILHTGKYFFCRTYWDKAWVMFSNPNANIFQGEELLRSEFYKESHSWSVNKCNRHSIFMPSGFNPIKGLYLAVKAVALLKKYYNDITLIVPGVSYDDVFKNSIWELIKGEKYIRYVRNIIEEEGLKKNIFFVGRLSAEQMAEKMKESNVFLSPSSIDNSPNAVGEATMIGIPVVTTPVGGVPSFLRDEESCLFAPAGDEYMMAYQIMRIFNNDDLATRLSHAAGIVANKRHNIEEVSRAYLNAYKTITNIQ